MWKKAGIVRWAEATERKTPGVVRREESHAQCRAMILDRNMSIMGNQLPSLGPGDENVACDQKSFRRRAV